MASSKTAERYRYIFDMLSRAAVKAGGSADAAALGALVAGADYAKSTRVLYAAAVRFCWEGTVQVSAFNDALRGLAAPSKAKRKPRRQSISLPEGLFEAVVRTLEGRQRMWERALALKGLITGVRYFGLRPREWEGAFWKDETRRVLVVRNAKFADGVIERGPLKGCVWKRGNGREREMELGGSFHDFFAAIAEDAMAAARQCPYSVENNGRVYRWTHRSALNVLRKGNEFTPAKLKHITIYSYRHAFSSDAKATYDVEGGAVAALLGHISTKTAISHYAKKTARSGRVIVKPSAESINAVTVHDARLGTVAFEKSARVAADKARSKSAPKVEHQISETNPVKAPDKTPDIR